MSAEPRRGVVDRIVASYSGMRRETLSLYASRPSEAVLFSFIMIGGLGVACGRILTLALGAAGLTTGEERAAFLGLSLVAAFVLLPLGLYLVSVAATPLMRLLGGEGGFYETRLAFAWSTAVAFPLVLIFAVLDVVRDARMLSDLAGFTLKIAPTALWAYLLASALGAVHGFRSARPVLGATAALACAAVAIVYVASGAL